MISEQWVRGYCVLLVGGLIVNKVTIRPTNLANKYFCGTSSPHEPYREGNPVTGGLTVRANTKPQPPQAPTHLHNLAESSPCRGTTHGPRLTPPTPAFVPWYSVIPSPQSIGKGSVSETSTLYQASDFSPCVRTHREGSGHTIGTTTNHDVVYHLFYAHGH